jgi:hypothetical protein
MSYAQIPEFEDLNVDEVIGSSKRMSSFQRFGALVTLCCAAGFAVVMVSSQMKGSFASGLFGTSKLNEEPAPLEGSWPELTVTSTSFEADGTMPDQYTCKLGTETGVSPPLAWSGAPDGTVDYMITMKKESGYSWSLYDLGTLDHVDEAVCNAAGPGATVGQAAGTEAWDIDVPPFISTANYVSMYKYEEPCSKGPGSKWYLFTVYAFNRKVTEVIAENNFAKENTKPTQILEVMKDYIVAKGEITAYFSLYGDDAASATAAKTATKAQATANQLAASLTVRKLRKASH